MIFQIKRWLKTFLLKPAYSETIQIKKGGEIIALNTYWSNSNVTTNPF